MSAEYKKNILKIEALRKRASMLKISRDFFETKLGLNFDEFNLMTSVLSKQIQESQKVCPRLTAKYLVEQRRARERDDRNALDSNVQLVAEPTVEEQDGYLQEEQPPVAEDFVDYNACDVDVAEPMVVDSNSTNGCSCVLM